VPDRLDVRAKPTQIARWQRLAEVQDQGLPQIARSLLDRAADEAGIPLAEGETQQIALPIDADLHRQIRIRAAEGGVSMNAWIRTALARGLNGAEPHGTPDPPAPLIALTSEDVQALGEIGARHGIGSPEEVVRKFIATSQEPRQRGEAQTSVAVVEDEGDEIPPEPPAPTPPPAAARTPGPSPPSPQEPGLSDFARRSIR
jgi:plasmid stability protein